MRGVKASFVTIAQKPYADAVSAVRRHQIVTYFLLAFAISWGGILLLVLTAGLQQTSDQLVALFVPVFLVTLLGPSLSCLILTVTLEGRAGVRALFGQFTRWRIGGRYYLLALAAPAVALVVLGIFSAFSPIFFPTARRE